MQESLRKLFMNEKFFFGVFLANFISCGTLGVSYIYPQFELYNVTAGLVMLLTAVCVITLFASYKNHAKNVMKGMMGALLMALVISAFILVESRRVLDVICGWINVLLVLGFAVDHFMINGTHLASPAKIRVNQVLLAAIVVNKLVWDVLSILISATSTVIFAAILDVVATASIAGAVVCVETRLDAYRLKRESAGWTEEKGYPKEYDRTKNYGK